MSSSVLAKEIYEALQKASFDRRKEHLLGKPTLRADEQDITLIDQKLSGVRENAKDVREESGIMASIADTCALKVANNPDMVADLRGIETKGNGLARKTNIIYETLKIDNVPEDTEK